MYIYIYIHISLQAVRNFIVIGAKRGRGLFLGMPISCAEILNGTAYLRTVMGQRGLPEDACSAVSDLKDLGLGQLVLSFLAATWFLT